MPPKHERNLERLRERLDNGVDDLSDTDRSLLKKFDDEISLQRGRRFGVARHDSLLHVNILLARRVGGLDRLLVDADDAELGEPTEDQIEAKEAGEEFARHIQNNYENGGTQAHYIEALRRLVELIGRPDLVPNFDRIFRVSFESEPGDSTPDPGTILRWQDDVVPMIEEAKGWRDAAAVAGLWSSGCRPESEFYHLTYGDLHDRGNYILITADETTKTGTRDIRLYTGAPYIRKWLRHHPLNNGDGLEPDDYLWVNRQGGRISYVAFSGIFRRLGERADITKPHNPEHFRRSRASVLAMDDDMTQTKLENHFGWVRGSDAAGHYIARFSDNTGHKVGLADGLKLDDLDGDEDESDPIAPVKCPTCDQWTPRFRTECLWCPTEIDVTDLDDPTRAREAQDTEGYEEARRDIVKMVTDGDLTLEEIQTARQLEEVIRDYPELLDHIQTLRTALDNATSE